MKLSLSQLSDNPLVSVVVPSFNQGKFIRETIDSILSQDYRPLEVIVIDGGSTDETVEILHQYDHTPEVSWISEKDSGPVEAVNKGFTRARGELCAIQSSDDFYLPGAISRVVANFKSDERLGLVYGDVVKVDSTGVEIQREVIPPFSLEGLLARETYVPQPSAFFRLDLARLLGGWDKRIPYVPDTDMWFRMAFRTGVKKVNDFLACSRSHPEQRDTQVRSIYRDYALMLAQSPDIASSPRRLKRAAKAGLHLLSARYNAHQTEWELTKSLWKAIILRPQCLFYKTLPKHRLIPSYFKIAKRVGHVRRFCGRFLNLSFGQ